MTGLVASRRCTDRSCHRKECTVPVTLESPRPIIRARLCRSGQRRARAGEDELDTIGSLNARIETMHAERMELIERTNRALDDFRDALANLPDGDANRAKRSESTT